MSAAPSPVHQALHGYRDGHRLLASSVPINELDQRQMLVLSDSADARQIPPESPLLCGYPLPSGEYYVLAFTWPALEVRRPGCVWTHSLLISEPLLSAADLTALLGAFSRPRLEGDGWGSYSEALDPRSFSARGPGTPLQRAPAVTETLLWSLYEPPAPPIDLRSASLKGVDQHRFLLAIWLQQSPALRASFAFAQAPRTARRLGERLFDLQLTGNPQQGSWEEPADRPAPRTITKPLERQPPNWCAALRADLKSPGALRDFLRDFGCDELGSREGIWALAAVFAALDPAYQSDLASGLRALARVCPDPAEAAALKQALFSGKPDPRLPCPVDQLELLLALASSELDEDGNTHGLSDRLTELLKVDERLVLRLTGELLERRRSKAAAAGLEAIGAALTKAQIKRWAAEDPELLARLAVHSQPLLSRPALLTSLDFKRAWPILGKSHMAKLKRASLLEAALEGGAEEFAEVATTSWPDGIELLLVAIHSTNSDAGLSRLLEDTKAKPVVSWLETNGPSPAVASALLDAWSPKKLEKVPISEWEHLLKIGGTLSDFTLVLLFLAAADPETCLGPQTAVRAYDELYRRLRSTSKLKPKALERLGDATRDRKAPPLEQAGDLLASGFGSGKWPAEQLLSIEKPAALRQVLASPAAAPLIAALIPVLDSSGATKEQGGIVWDALFASEDVSFVEKALTPVREAILWPSRFLRR